MKKIGLILINLLLLALIVGAGKYLMAVWQERQVTDFLHEKRTALAPNNQYVLQEGNVGSTHVIAYVPTNEKRERIATMGEAMQSHVRELIGERKPVGKIDEFLFVVPQELDTHFSKVKQLELVTHRFEMDHFKISEEKSERTPSILIAEDLQVFTLDRLFTNKDAVKEVIANQVKKVLEEKVLPADQVTASVEKVKQLNLGELAFSYENSQLSLVLPEQKIGIATLSLNISDLFEVLDISYLAAEDQKKYEEYQAEKARKAQEKMIALTFDDGPNPATTTRILDLLKKYNAKATFFILGQNIAGNEDILKRMVAEGHEVANHSWSHPNLTTLPPEQVKQEVEQTQVAIEKAIGKRPTMMRPPYGAVNQMVMNTMNLPAIYWSVDSLDWKSRNPQAILSVVQANTQPGSIILMHDIHAPTADALEPVLQYLQSQGLTTGTMTDLVGKNLNPQYVYYDRTSARPAQ